jgi:hypothetical protein
MNRDLTKVDFKNLTKEEWEELLKSKKLEEEFDKIIAFDGKPITEESNECLEEIVEIYEPKCFNY